MATLGDKLVETKDSFMEKIIGEYNLRKVGGLLAILSFMFLLAFGGQMNPGVTETQMIWSGENVSTETPDRVLGASNSFTVFMNWSSGLIAGNNTFSVDGVDVVDGNITTGNFIKQAGDVVLDESDEADLNVNSSDYWNGFDVASDLDNRILVKQENVTNEDWIEDSQESNLNVNDSDTVDGEHATAFMDAGTDNWVDETGDSMTGNLDMGQSNITNVSKLGVGTANPEVPLDISKSVPKIRLTDNDLADMYAEMSGGGGSLALSADPNRINAARNINFAVGGSEAMRVDKDGDVGIGTTNPGAKLHVNGSIKSEGDLNMTGNNITAVETIDVKQVQNVVDKIVNSTSELQSAFNNLQSGQTIYISQPNTSYRTTEWLDMNGVDDVTIIFQQPFTQTGSPIVKPADGADVGGIRIGNSAACKNIKIKNFGFHGNAGNQDQSVKRLHGIKGMDADNIHILGGYMTRTSPYHEHNSGGSGITVYPNSSNWEISGVEIEDIGDRSIQLAGTGHNIHNNYIHNGFDRGLSFDMNASTTKLWYAADDCRVHDNLFEDFSNGSCIAVSHAPTSGNVISDNRMIGQFRGAVQFDENGCKNNKITGNVISHEDQDLNQAGIICVKCTIANNLIVENGEFSNIFYSVLYSTIEGNHIRINTDTTITTDKAGGVVFTDNTIHMNQTSQTLITTSNNMLISNNQFFDHGDVIINASSNNIVIRGNGIRTDGVIPPTFVTTTSSANNIYILDNVDLSRYGGTNASMWGAFGTEPTLAADNYPSLNLSTFSFQANGLKQGLVGFWGFEQNGQASQANKTYDSSREGNDGVMHNMTASDWVAGKQGTALDFDGSDDYVIVPYFSELDSQTLTVSGWVKPSSVVGAGNRVLDYFSGGDFGWRIDLTSTKNRLSFNLVSGGSSYTETIEDFWSLREWTFFTIAYDNGNLTFYKNGVLEKKTTIPKFDSTGGSLHLELGRNQQGGSLLNGSIDSVRVYNRSLSSQEVQALYLGLGDQATGHLNLK